MIGKKRGTLERGRPECAAKREGQLKRSGSLGPGLQQTTPSVVVISDHRDLREWCEPRCAAMGLEVLTTIPEQIAGVRAVVLDPRAPTSQTAATWAERHNVASVVVQTSTEQECWRLAWQAKAHTVTKLDGASPGLATFLANVAEGQGKVGESVGVVGAVGGCGATTFASALMRVLAGKRSVLGFDLDPTGVGLRHVLGLEDVAGWHWGSLAQAEGLLSGRALLEHCPHRHGLRVLGFDPDDIHSVEEPITAEVAHQAVQAAQRAGSPVVVDLPRQASAPALIDTLQALQVVVPRNESGLVAARILAARWHLRSEKVGWITVAGRGGVPIPRSAFLEETGIEVRAEFRWSQRAGRVVARGQLIHPRSSLGRAARACGESIVEAATR